MEFEEYIEEQCGLKIVALKKTNAVWQLHTVNGLYALKWWRGKEEDMLLMLAACEHLAANGFELMAKPCGHGFWQGQYFYISPWLMWERADFRIPELRRSAIQSLAQMHKAGEGFRPPAVLANRRNNIGVWRVRLQKRLEELAQFGVMAAAENDDFSRLFASLVPEALKNGKRAIKILTNQGYSEYIKNIEEISPVCHGDFVWHNVLAFPAGCVLLDFDNMARDSRLSDVARLLRTGEKNCRWPVYNAAENLMYYNRAYPLSLDEREYLWAFMEFPHNIWRLGEQRYLKGKMSAKMLAALSLERDLLYYEPCAIKLI
jgi:CotS family spore coat protein